MVNSPPVFRGAGHPSRNAAAPYARGASLSSRSAQGEAEARVAEGLEHAALDRAVAIHRDGHGVEERAAVLGAAVAGGADAAEVRAQASAAAAGDDEVRAVVDVVVEQQ